MANLKLDLLNKLRNEKYYKEMELVRLAQEPSMCYEEKIDKMVVKLKELHDLNGQMLLMEQYFTEPVPQQVAPAPEVAPAGVPVVEKPAEKVHPGQSHGEG
jgi:hypothetical protein